MWKWFLFLFTGGFTCSSVFGNFYVFPTDVRTIFSSAYLPAHVGRMVAIGYTLYSGEFVAGPSAIREYVLTNEEAWVFRYTKKTVNTTHKRVAAVVEFAEGGVYTEGKMDSAVSVLVKRVYADFAELSAKWWHIERDGWGIYALYPSGLEAQDGLTLTTLSGRSVKLTASDAYQIYRGEVDVPAGSKYEEDVVKLVETITIDGHNPYVLYRFTQLKDAHGRDKGSILSVGVYDVPALSPLSIKAVVLYSTVFEVKVGNEQRYDYDGFHANPAGKRKLGIGELEVRLDMVSTAAVWNEIEGNIGVTGGGLAYMLKSAEAKEIATDLRTAMETRSS